MSFTKPHILLLLTIALSSIAFAAPLKPDYSEADSVRINKQSFFPQKTNLADSVINFGKLFLNTPYGYGSAGSSSFDCSGFTQYAFARAGISIPRMADSQLYYGRQISMSELRPGDLIFFSTYEPGASHCGIYLGDGKFIHAGTSTGVVVADAFTGYWGERYYGACRVL